MKPYIACKGPYIALSLGVNFRENPIYRLKIVNSGIQRSKIRKTELRFFDRRKASAVRLLENSKGRRQASAVRKIRNFSAGQKKYEFVNFEFRK